MGIYNFAPKGCYHQNHPFVTWENGFSGQEIDKIVEICENLPMTTAVVGFGDDGVVDDSVRSSKISWLGITEESNWIYERMGYIARSLNAQFYDFDLSGFVEDMQFTTYYADEKGHYTWHNDMASGDGNSIAPRKFSMVLQLSDPAAYEGGELQTFTALEPCTVTKSRGLVAAFPSWTLHRVTPITSGVRKSLVVWVAGKQFR